MIFKLVFTTYIRKIENNKAQKKKKNSNHN